MVSFRRIRFDMNGVGEKIRSVRKQKGWTLERLAAETGLSTSFLSQVERGQSAASLASLDCIATSLGKSLPEMLGGPLADISVVMPSDGSGKPVSCSEASSGVGICRGTIGYWFLSQDLTNRELEIIIGELPGDVEFEPAAHAGEEFGYVLQGRLALIYDGKDYELEVGDSYHFKATTPHGYKALGQGGARVLWVQTLTYDRPAPRNQPGIKRAPVSS